MTTQRPDGLRNVSAAQAKKPYTAPIIDLPGVAVEPLEQSCGVFPASSCGRVARPGRALPA